MRVNAFIIGTQKSGTTSLLRGLSKHPEVNTHEQLECTFFYLDKEFSKGVKYLKKNYFYTKESSKKLNLIKHASAIHFKFELRNAIEHNPEMKFIIILRNPVQRFISSYFMEVERSNYNKSIHEALEIAFNDHESFEYRAFNLYGKYDLAVANILEITDIKNVKFILFEDLKDDPGTAYKEIFAFLNLAPLKNQELSNNSNQYKKKRNKALNSFVNKAKKSFIGSTLRRLTPVKLKIKLNKSLDSALYKNSSTKPEIPTNVYSILTKKYKASILNFEKTTGIKTNWIND